MPKDSFKKFINIYVLYCLNKNIWHIPKFDIK